jgi:hypothetical protein
MNSQGNPWAGVGVSSTLDQKFESTVELVMKGTEDFMSL